MSLKLVPISPFVSVTETGTSAALKLQSALIQKIVADGSGSVLTVIGKNGSNGIEKYSVTQTPAQVAALTQIHIELSEYSTSTWRSMYVNAMCFRDQIFDESTHRVVFLDFGGGARSFRVTQSLATLLTGLNTSIPSEPLPVVSVATGATITTTSSATIVNMTAAGAGTVTLPVAVVGNMLYINNTSAFDITLAANAGETIDGGADTVVPAGSTLIVYSAALLAWQSAVGQVGNTRVFYTNDVRPADSASPINIAGAGNGVNISETTGDAKLQTASGNTVVETATGIVLIQATGAASQVIVDGGPTNPVDIDGTGIVVPNAIRPQLDDVTTGIEFTGSPVLGTAMDFVVDNGAAVAQYQMGTQYSVANGFGSSYIDSLFFIGSQTATGAAVPGVLATKAHVNVTVNALNNGVQFHSAGGTYFVVRNAGANPVFFWDENSVAIRATALAPGSYAEFRKVGGTWVSQDFVPVA